MVSFTDGEIEPFMEVRANKRKNPTAVLICRQRYVRAYKNGVLAVRVKGEQWDDGDVMQADLDERSASKMYPVLLFSNAPPEDLEDK